ncbi:MAG: hypothetical protein Q4C65_03535 [Eubacteriales bacterium]|nr:hypothetical protein [Eubacteriales bacterium]
MKKSEKLLDAIGEIDDKYIMDAAAEPERGRENGKMPGKKTGRKRLPFGWQRALAACAALAVCVGLAALLQTRGLLIGPAGGPSGEADEATAPREEQAAGYTPEEAAEGALANGDLADGELQGRSLDGELQGRSSGGEMQGQSAPGGEAQDGQTPALASELPGQEGVGAQLVQADAEGISYELSNHSGEAFTYGARYELVRLTETGGETVEPKEQVAWEDIAYELEDGESVQESEDFSAVYGRLEPGSYQLLKPGYLADGREITVTVEFEVE